MDGVITRQVFITKHKTLSFTHQDETLLSDESLDQYQQNKQLKFGDLPAICRLTYDDLINKLKPPLPPRHDPVDEDIKYGHLHYCTDRPINDKHSANMARLATLRGIVREFVPKKKRIDLK